MPPGVFSVVTGDGARIVNRLLRSPVVRKLPFTGSTDVGRMLIRQSAANLSWVSMELGGHAPFIVFDTANFEHAVEGCLAAKFATSGQDCLAANRIYVQRSIYVRFCEEITARVRKLKIGSGFDDAVDIGSLDPPAADRLQRLQLLALSCCCPPA